MKGNKSKKTGKNAKKSVKKMGKMNAEMKHKKMMMSKCK